jgi:hypothetical protein
VSPVKDELSVVPEGVERIPKKLHNDGPLRLQAAPLRADRRNLRNTVGAPVLKGILERHSDRNQHLRIGPPPQLLAVIGHRACVDPYSRIHLAAGLRPEGNK